MVDSILNSIKKTLGIPSDIDEFDTDVIMHTNTALSTLTQLGVGPPQGFAIQGPDETWDQLVDDDRFVSVRSFVFLRVKLLFDPPATSFHLTAINEQLDELVWRINVVREEDEWVDPDPDPEVTVEV